jgi:hypothetical protein
VMRQNDGATLPLQLQNFVDDGLHDRHFWGGPII